MNLDLAKDRFITHSITNYLCAGYEGRFAALNLLSQFGAAEFDVNELTTLQVTLNKVSAWSRQLFEDECLFSASWTKPETFDAQNALDLLEALKPDLRQEIERLQILLTLPQPPNSEEVKHLLSAYARHCYSRDTYVRGFLDYGKAFGLTESFSRYLPFQMQAEEEVKQLHRLSALFRKTQCDAQKLDPEYFAVLHGCSHEIPYIFKTQIHDINQLMSQFKGGFNFSLAEFSPAEVSQWEPLSFGPVAAGYWRAYEIPPEEAQAWSDARFTEAATVYQWRSLGFVPTTAAAWLEHSFAAAYAFEWLQAGYNPIEAKHFIERGISQPPPKQSS